MKRGIDLICEIVKPFWDEAPWIAYEKFRLKNIEYGKESIIKAVNEIAYNKNSKNLFDKYRDVFEKISPSIWSNFVQNNCGGDLEKVVAELTRIHEIGNLEVVNGENSQEFIQSYEGNSEFLANLQAQGLQPVIVSNRAELSGNSAINKLQIPVDGAAWTNGGWVRDESQESGYKGLNYEGQILKKKDPLVGYPGILAQAGVTEVACFVGDGAEDVSFTKGLATHFGKPVDLVLMLHGRNPEKVIRSIEKELAGFTGKIAIVNEFSDIQNENIENLDWKNPSEVLQEINEPREIQNETKISLMPKPF